MPIIVPTITTDSQDVFNDNIIKFSQFSKRIQVDVSDGTFAPTTLLPISNIVAPEEVEVDLHVMSARPSEHLADILNLKPRLCIVHAEVDDDLNAFFAKLKEANIKVGLAMIKTTFPGRVQSFIAMADHVMLFAGELGRQGGIIDMLQTEKVPLIRQIKPEAEIGWDGGANLSNVRALAHAGIDVINVGSAITQAADAGAMYQSLAAEIEKRGVLV